jgi:lipoprotein-releasing system permease protein
MYKLLLCLRYLRTRYIALASIISVMLGVATMIVVNSVMAGFTREMQDRIHGVLSDVVLEVRNLEGAPDAEGAMQRIHKAAGDAIAGMTPMVVVPAMLTFRYGEQTVTRQVELYGIDEVSQGRVSDFCRFLQHPENRRQMSFELREAGYDVRDHQAGPEARDRPQMKSAGWQRRRSAAKARVFEESWNRSLGERPAKEAASQPGDVPEDPFLRGERAETVRFDPATQQRTGLVMGIVLGSIRTPSGEDRFLVLPGDDVQLTFPTIGMRGLDVAITRDWFTVVDFYECKMSEYDARFAFVPIRALQKARGMIDPQSGVANFNAIQIKLKPGANAEEIRDKIQREFDAYDFVVQTWRDKQGPLLAAVQMETAILNVLLFLIIAVSGFGILAIFFMIVVEKTRDIGILKSLGASGAGVMGIFLGYGLSLGLVGSGVGLVLGLLFVRHINGLAALLGKVTGRPVFDPSIYYFYKIPTLVDPWTVTSIMLGAVSIAVLASVLPAVRAAVLHPVEALRYE